MGPPSSHDASTASGSPVAMQSAASAPDGSRALVPPFRA